MEAFEIETTTSDYSFLVIAKNITSAINTICIAKNIKEHEIEDVHRIDSWTPSNIVIENY